jgi:Spy/CpxP family protein refolding chaperone
MNNKWLKLLLLASIAFNIAFIGSGLFRKAPGPKPEKSVETKQEKPYDRALELRQTQKEDIGKIIKAFKIKMLESKQDILDKRIAIIEAMSDPEFDPEDVKTKTGELNELENQLNLIFVNSLIEITEVLDDQQRLNFLIKLSRNWFFMKGNPKRSPKRSMPPGGGSND